jgi:hypothetical protein
MQSHFRGFRQTALATLKSLAMQKVEGSNPFSRFLIAEPDPADSSAGSKV